MQQSGLIELAAVLRSKHEFACLLSCCPGFDNKLIFELKISIVKNELLQDCSFKLHNNTSCKKVSLVTTRDTVRECEGQEVGGCRGYRQIGALQGRGRDEVHGVKSEWTSAERTRTDPRTRPQQTLEKQPANAVICVVELVVRRWADCYAISEHDACTLDWML